MLEVRQHSTLELRRKLLRKGHDAEGVDGELAALQRAGLLDDGRFAAAVVRSRSSSRGSRAIAAELRLKGVDRDDSDAALSGLGENEELEAATRLARRRVRFGADRREIEAMAARLLRRGFPPAIAWAACRAASSADLDQEAIL